MASGMPVFQLSNNAIICYEEFQVTGGKRGKNPLSASNLTRGVTKGIMSEKTRSTLKKRIQTYYDAMNVCGRKFLSDKKIAHPIVTLTLPSAQAHTDNEIKRECLMRWVEAAKYNYDVRFFYWVAEKQKNDNIHFHVLLDRYIPHEWVRDKWNDRVEHLGYVSTFESRHGHRNPNSTDIQAIKSLLHSSDYVTKYTTKVDQQGLIQGRLHGECDRLKQCTRYKEEMFSDMYQKLFELGHKKVLNMKRLDGCVVFKGNIRRVMAGHMPKTLERWNDYLHDLGTSFYN